MNLAKLVSTARSLELVKKEMDFLKNNTLHSDTHTIGVDTISDNRRRNNHPRGGKYFKKQAKKTIKICRYHTQIAAKPAIPSVIFVTKKDILEKSASPLIPR